MPVTRNTPYQRITPAGPAADRPARSRHRARSAISLSPRRTSASSLSSGRLSSRTTSAPIRRIASTSVFVLIAVTVRFLLSADHQPYSRITPAGEAGARLEITHASSHLRWPAQRRARSANPRRPGL
ncbi:hypothetical protein PseBG33_1332 [Pseudomonas synxantha BG33R]|nr:hypothetical protein PseBG33_1332 [Pseudomonas synxantha BG33R]